jgi:energy-coupling factor transporter ATP-binding protein EcfA2
MAAVLEVRDVSFAYGDAPILTDVSLEVRAGEFVALAGGNGAGKSTLLRVVLGLLHPATGSVALDRSRGEQIITNSAATWPGARDWVWPSVETIHETILRTRPGAYTVSINEPTDRGASWSTFDDIRQGTYVRPNMPEELPFSTERFVRPSKDYRWSSKVDHLGMEHAVRIWSSDEPKPAFMWCNFTLTDAAFHEGGPHSDIAMASIRDTDARLGEILAGVERAGVWDTTAFFLVADHGMEESNPEVTGDWGPVLERAGIDFRDEAYGFLYLEG